MIAETSERARQIAEEFSTATEKERELSREIAIALESLRKTSQANSELVKKINTSSEQMTDLSSSLKKELAMFKVSEMVEKDRPSEDEETG
jgi:methyl-accepting chemotaxis protein